MKKSNKIMLAVLATVLVAMLAVVGVSLWNNRPHAVPAVGDVSWYDETGKEFTLTTMEQFYGLAELSKSYDFKGQTIKLGEDIVVNEGDAEDWVKTPPEYLWIPITGFAGRFDGQGHTISGIYGDSIITSLGLFTDTQKTCVIKDLKLVNSFFKNNNDKGTGSIIGVGGGKLENIYSDAILTGAGNYFGGFIGRVTTKGENQITNCWFNGVMTMKGSDASEVGGIVGAFTVEDAINAVQHCLSTADIECMGENVGGICGNVGSGSFLNLIDSMYTGKLTYDTNKYDKVGSVIGQITGGSTAMLRDTYTVDEIANRTIGTNGGYQEGSAIAVASKHLLGEGGYQWTTLDFNNYWAAQKDKTPILTQFADSSVSVSGLERLVDISWYNPTGATFVINSTEQFYGFAYLSRSYDFSGQTIKLGADITVNEGNAEDWQEEAPEYEWTPIAWHGTSLSKRFKGTFDGQGHTISGIYLKGSDSDGYIGLFGEIYNSAVVKNFRIVNSYFEGTMASSVRGCVGSICGRNRGTIEGIYSNAIIVNSARMTGGIAGMINGTGQNIISNCWFDGKITGITRTGGILGGVYGNKANIEATIEHCLNTGDIAVKIGYGDVGGICGIAETWSTLYIKDCLNTGTFKTIGDDKKANTHIGTIFGSVTQTSDVGSKVEITNSFGVKEFYSRLVGWKFGDEGVVQSSVAFVSNDEVKGYGGYQWTTLDFKNSWAVRKEDVPVPVVFATSRPSTSGVVRMVDYSWYKPESKEYTIKTVQQLYAFSRLWDVTNLFKDKTIKLGADITVNEGNAADWAEKAPAFVWIPARLRGTFDGQGHTISGIYVKGGEEDNYLGLFHRIYQDATVKNLKLVNSYFEGTMPSNKRGAVGSIAGRNNGTIDSVYSNAIVVNSARMTGGIVGMITGEGQNKITNSWFDGKITGITRTGGILGGVYGNKEKIEATIEHCLNTGDIAVQIGYGDVGGLCGMVETWSTLNLTDSMNAGTFATIGNDKKANTHIGSIVGSITQTDDVGSRVVMNHVYGVQEFYSKLVGWSYTDEAVKQSSVYKTDMAKINGFGGYQWTTLNFDKYWAVRMEDVPVPVAFAESRPSLSAIAKMADYSWYDSNSDVYTINNLKQLYGFAVLCNADDQYFKDKTVKLGADITVNKGNAADWAEKAPEFVWTPVRFRGTFDGQGHTISGIYVKGGAEDNYLGFFHRVYTGATVKNFKLVNSYIEGTMANNVRGAVGSIAGRNNGIIDSVYSDAIVVNSARMTGGIVGMITGTGENKIANSWFDGQVTGITRTGGILGGVYGNKENIEATIEHCLNTCDITVPVNYEDIGGLCGMVETWATLNLTDSLNAGAFTHVGEGDAKTHIGTIVGSITETDNVGSRVVMNHVYGVDEFYSKLVGWSWNKTSKGVSQSSVNMTDMAEATGYSGYQWTTLDFDKSWAVRTEDVPIPIVFAESRPNLEKVTRMVDYSWYDGNSDEYTIKTLQQLYGFNLLCNADHDYFNGKTIKLGADITLNSGDANTWAKTAPANIWTPTSFKGTLDGQGHTLSGIYVKGTGTYTGFFTTIESGAVVKNLSLKDSYIEGNGSQTRSGVGSIAGRNHGTIDTVYSNAIVNNSKQMTGGIAGMTTSSEAENVITNCWFDGQINANGSTGGILGGVYKASANIEHCLNTGVLNINAGSSAIGGLCGNVQDASSVAIDDSLNAGSLTQVGEGTIKQFGTLVGALGDKGSLTLGDVYGISKFSEDKIGYHKAGTLTQAKSTASLVMGTKDIKGYDGYQWTSLDFEQFWAVRTEEVPVLATFADSKPSLDKVTRMVDYSWYDSENDVFTINDFKQLYAFAKLCNANTDYFAGKTVKLSADITLNEGNAEDWMRIAPENIWTPISFKGTFDGQGHTISEVYVKTTNTYTGFFNTIYSGAVVKDFNLVNSYFEGNGSDTRSGVGSIAGLLQGTIDTVHSDAIVKNSKQMTGGIAGLVTKSETALITNCWFSGTLYVNNNASGGILGGTYGANGSDRDENKATIMHCLNTGILNIKADSATVQQVGGLCGYVQNYSSLVLEDSLNAGECKKEIIGNGKIQQIGTAVGAVHANATRTLSSVYGTSDKFSETLIGWDGSKGEAHVLSTVRSMDKIKGYGAYQWTTLDFEDVDNNGDDKAYWVLKDGMIPALVVFDKDDNNDLKLEDAKKLPNYSWYFDDVEEYEISTPQRLMEFNDICNEEDSNYFAGKTIKLVADITLNEGDAEDNDWMNNAPENEWITQDFNGTFDGQGHTISGLYVKSAEDVRYTGLFATINDNAVVKDLKLVNSYIEGTYTHATNTRAGVGSIAGCNHGTIEKVYSEAIVKNSKQMTGGIAGTSIAEGNNIITNCWFNGKIYASQNSVGGILGGSYAVEATIEHCLNTGTVNITSGSATIQAIGGLCGQAQSTAQVNVIDSLNTGKYEKVGTGTVRQLGTTVGTVGNQAKLTVSNTYGISAFSENLLGYQNNNVTRTSSAVRTSEELEGIYAYQWTTLDFEDIDGEGTDEKYWVLIDGKHPTLKAFNNTDDSTLLEDAKKLINYGWYAEDASEYVISTPQQLLGFNEYCNVDNDYFAGKTIKLGANIALNDVTDSQVAGWIENEPGNEIKKWTSKEFKGTFDGQEYTISGVYSKTTGTYTGLFHTIHSEAAVKNLRLVNSYFEGTKSSGRAGTGSIAGQLKGGIIDTVYSDAIVINDKAEMTGGIVGMVNGAGDNLITNCWFDGQIHGFTSTGGILGGTYQQTAYIKHCLNTGTLVVVSNAYYSGGLFGRAQSTNANVIVEDSLNAGILNGIGKNTGNILGRIDNGATLSNVYGVTEFSTTSIEMCGNGGTKVSSESNFELTLKENLYGRRASRLSFYADNASSADDDTPKLYWWRSRTDKIPMLESFEDLAATLSK